LGEYGACVIYQVTLLAYAQEIKDLWDGVVRPIMDFRNTALEDKTIHLASDYFDSEDDLTYINLKSFTTSDYLYFGFAEKVSAITLHIYGGGNTNLTAMAVDCWNGGEWISMNIEDGTYANGCSMNRGGTINVQTFEMEEMRSYKQGYPYYYYRIHFSAQLSAGNIYLYYVTAVPRQKNIGSYLFPVMWQNKLLLCNETTSNPNRVFGSTPNTHCVFNGSGITDLYIGDGSAILAGETLFSRFGGSVYENLVLFKRNAIYLVDGDNQSNYRIYTISDKVGIAAPRTLRRCDVSFEVVPGLKKHVLIWLASGGVMMFDGNTLNCISGDIGSYFDRYNSNAINTSYADISEAFYDPENNEYHLLCPTGSSTTINTELVYDLTAQKWFTIDRGAGKALKCGFIVSSPKGLIYNYGAINSYILRLEYGTTFDGNDIIHKFRLADVSLSGSMMLESELRKLKLTAVVKNTETSTVSCNYYVDGNSTASALTPFSQANSTTRYYDLVRSHSIKGIIHSPEFILVNNQENIGFEPLMVSGSFRVIREDW
jgi:hypothetical protein